MAVYEGSSARGSKLLSSLTRFVHVGTWLVGRSVGWVAGLPACLDRMNGRVEPVGRVIKEQVLQFHERRRIYCRLRWLIRAKTEGYYPSPSEVEDTEGDRERKQRRETARGENSRGS